MKHVVLKDLPSKELLPGISLRSIHLDKVMVTFVDLEEGALVPPHRHPHEQISLIISGSLLYNVEGEAKLVRAGEAVLVPADAEHSVSVLDGPVLAYDVFHPVREDYIFDR